MVVNTTANRTLKLFLFSAFAAANAASAASHMLPSGSLICDSANKFEAQIDRIASRDYNPIPGCGITDKAITVELEDFSLLGATKVYAPSIQQYIFVDGSDLK